MLSIITNTFNHIDITQQCLPKIAASAGVPVELLVNDNNSTDGVLQWLSGLSFVTEIIAQRENIGNPQGLNQLLERTKGEFIAVVAPDFILPDMWGAKLIKLLIENPAIGLTGFHWARGLKHPHLQKGVAVKLETETVYLPIKVFGIWVFRRILIQKVGCFMDTLSKYGCWDTEFQQRIRRNGYINVYHSEDSTHVGSDSNDPDHRKFKDNQLQQAKEAILKVPNHEFWMDSPNFNYEQFKENSSYL